MDRTSFPLMTPELNQCIEKTLRSDKDVNFNRAEESEDYNTKTFSGENIYTSTYSYLYNLKTLDCRGCHFQMNVSYERSKDSNHNKTRFSHRFGALNTKFTEEQKKIAKVAMDRLEDSLQKHCGLTQAVTQ